MIRRAAKISALAALALGCSTTRVVGPVATPAAVEMIEAENGGRPVTVEVLSKDTAPEPASKPRPTFTLVRATPEQIVVTADSDRGEFGLPNASVKRLVVNNHARGALHGAGIGALIAGGLMAAAAISYSPCQDCEVATRGQSAEIVGIFIGIPVLLLTAGIGALLGAQTSYVFSTSGPTPR